MINIAPYGTDTVMSVAGYVALNYMLKFFRHTCQLFTIIVAIYLMFILVPGSVLSAVCPLSELYIYTHDYNSVNLKSVVVPPAGTSSFQLSLGNMAYKLLSFSSSPCLLCGSTFLHLPTYR